MKTERLWNMSLLVTLTIAIISCGEPQQVEDDTSDMSEIEVTQMDNPEENGFLYTLPSPLQIASIFRRSGLTYVPNLANNPGNVSNYNTKLIQKLNFGAYAADLAYSALNEQNQACIEYVQALSSLSESLWMTNVFSSVSILNRFENNMGNADSLGYIISDFQMELDNYLEENGLSTNSLVIFTGAWIESMHLALHDLIEILEKEDKDAEMDILLVNLAKISEHFASYDVESIENEEDLATLSMSDDNIAKLTLDVEETRKFIING